jgi:arginine decarboxylase
MEYSGKCEAKEAKEKIENMIREAFGRRGMEVVEIKMSAVEHRVQKIGCVIAAVPLWY